MLLRWIVIPDNLHSVLVGAKMSTIFATSLFLVDAEILLYSYLLKMLELV